MKKLSLIAVIIALLTGYSFSQFKDIPSETKTKLKNGNGMILGFINPKNFSINHSFNMSYMSGSNTSVSITSYTATLSYKILDNLKLSADVSMQYSPYASIGSNNPAINKNFQNSLNGINLSRVSLSYKPARNMFINIDYVNIKNPYLYDNYYYNRFWDNAY